MRRVRIAVIAGDGIGPEVMPPAQLAAARAALEAGTELEFTEFDWGSQYYRQHGRMMPTDALNQLRSFDALLLGAVGDPSIPDHVTLDGLLLPIRRAFDQFANVRPARTYLGIEGPVRAKQVDLVIVRENTEGEYAPVGGFVYHDQAAEVAIQTAVFTRRGCERIIRYAFELCQHRNRRLRVASITKSNAQAYGMVLWDRVFQAVAAEYPEIQTESLLVDAACMHLVWRPETFDVIVGSNLFGDILSDLAAAVTGSIGLAASANLDPSGHSPSLFEPVHGSAPDIAGKGVANPLAAILCAAMLLEHIGLAAAARRVEAAVEHVLSAKRHLPKDLGGHATTSEVSAAVLAHL